MHDDDAPITAEPDGPEGYWTEADWERFMLENEKLMDRYEEAWKQNPDRRWDDPLDLYHKVHYDLDLGEEVESEPFTPSPAPETSQPSEPTAASDESEARSEEGELDDFRKLPVYQLAYAFSLAVLGYLKRFNHETHGENPLRDELRLHALRIAADIAGGHGLGYEEDTLCGNVVKNRWALSHAQETRRLLQLVVERDGPDPQIEALLTQTGPIIKAIEERIVELRAKVWWDKAG